MKEILLKYGIPEEIVYAIIILIKSAAIDSGLSINTEKTEYININQKNNIQMKSIYVSVINKGEYFKYLGSYIRSTKRDVNIRISKSYAALNRMNIIWK